MGKKEFHPAAWLSNIFFENLSATKDFTEFHAGLTNATMRALAMSKDKADRELVPPGFPQEMREAWVSLITALSNTLGLLMVECYGKAHIIAGESAGFPTFRATFLDLLEGELRRFTAMYHPDEAARREQAERNKTELVGLLNQARMH